MESILQEDLFVVWHEHGKLLHTRCSYAPVQALIMARRIAECGVRVEAFYTEPPDNAEPWTSTSRVSRVFYKQ